MSVVEETAITEVLRSHGVPASGMLNVLTVWKNIDRSCDGKAPMPDVSVGLRKDVSFLWTRPGASLELELTPNPHAEHEWTFMAARETAFHDFVPANAIIPSEIVAALWTFVKGA